MAAERGGTEPHGGLPFTCAPGGIRLSVRLTPRAAADSLVGVTHDADGRPALQVRIAAPPVDGAANAALIAYLAKALKLRKSDIRIASGETARLKRVDLSGDAESIAVRLRAWIGVRQGGK
jgi:uncharacterized protein (TIGR00251 family)